MGDRLDDVAAKLAQLHDETFVAMQRSAECRARLNLLSVPFLSTEDVVINAETPLENATVATITYHPKLDRLIRCSSMVAETGKNVPTVDVIDTVTGQVVSRTRYV